MATLSQIKQYFKILEQQQTSIKLQIFCRIGTIPKSYITLTTLVYQCSQLLQQSRFHKYCTSIPLRYPHTFSIFVNFQIIIHSDRYGRRGVDYQSRTVILKCISVCSCVGYNPPPIIYLFPPTCFLVSPFLALHRRKLILSTNRSSF